MKFRKHLALFLCLALMASMLVACGGDDKKTEGDTQKEVANQDEAKGDFNLAVNIASEPDTIDPALNSAVDGACMILHTFEGLMKWEDDGNGKAVLVNGQIKDYEKGEVAEDGTVVYTFNLRDDIKWSDGKDVVAEDFVFALQRLVTPETAADYNYMADMILNANEIMAGDKDPSELAVVAKDEKTLEITLTYDCPYFLEVCAFPALMPIRKDIIEAHGDQWTFEPDTYLGNGPLKMTEWSHNEKIVMEPNEEYYNKDAIALNSLTFQLMDDVNSMYAGFRNGDLDFIEQVPIDEIKGLLESQELVVTDYIGTYYVSFNCEKEPFDNPKVREALSLAIDRNYIVDEITQTGQVPASGFVPAGVADVNPTGDDFRTIGGEYYSVKPEDYEKNCERARELLAEAGYPDGEGFPVVEYLYNTNENHKAIGEALQNMWQTELGITVNLNNQDWAVFLQTRKQGDFHIARNGWIADYNDPISFLDMWYTDGGNNDGQYSNKAYDALIDQVRSTSVQEERMKGMHDAEDILLGEDHFAAPIYFYTNKYMLNEDVGGMFYTPLGYFFFMYTHPVE